MIKALLNYLKSKFSFSRPWKQEDDQYFRFWMDQHGLKLRNYKDLLG